jgi:hypothetical protein
MGRGSGEVMAWAVIYIAQSISFSNLKQAVNKNDKIYLQNHSAFINKLYVILRVFINLEFAHKMATALAFLVQTEAD